jgi:hypothetical protein
MTIRGAVVSPGKSKSSYSDEWYTPPHIPASLGVFDLDPAAGPMSHATRNIRPPEDGLTAEWSGRVWLNPPYSNVHEWLEKFVKHGNGVVLVAARPETRWFQLLARNSSALFFLQARIEFIMPEGPTKHTPVGSVLVAYGANNATALRGSRLSGVMMKPVYTLDDF